ncbi:hypothetical protein [Marinobacter xestospongiae]|uniref:Uncharacterized protein n=1 Tax=Marinobacter xestospongiae TaxID=994319 RepID=A0ABU3VTH0_9GAMM|nr:hypothetical protein [Marinobacter xestospongiae]MDV2077544.1 hypothetical protein [Marinobacter xestospongiae]
MSTEFAQSLIATFSANNEVGVFSKIKKSDVVKGLRDRVKKPWLIYQDLAYLCGPAAFLFIIAKNNPEEYVKYIIDLYQNGSASLDELKVVAGRGCREYDLNLSQGYKAISAVDWIGLASLRDSENSFFNYDHHSDQFSGITLPGQLTSWFRKAGYNSIEERTNLVFDKGLSNLLEANRKYVAGHEVCLFVGAKILLGEAKGRAPADHWVVMTSPIQINNAPDLQCTPLEGLEEQGDSVYDMKISFKVYTWGEGSRPVNLMNRNLTVSQFLDYYYGYVAVQK